VTIQAQIIDLLKRLQERTGMAILFVTHDLGLVAEIAERALVMYAGQIVETSGVDELFDAPRMPYTRALLDAIPSLGCSSVPDYELRAIPGNAPNPLGLPSGCAFHPRCRYGEARCAGRNPSLDRIEDAHLVRCLRWRELDLGGMR
jgi:peptide/nickel transport system ATP-binding protein/oligopeptide transport system ATP-binding protein